ncbi:MAG TPA: hypothetical protein PLE69_05240 [bacterium]|nr:hypothetical protein [bacterium]
MLIWVFIILVMGVLLLFGTNFVVEYNLVKYIGLAVTLICIGIGTRMSALRRKGEKEKLLARIKELEDKIKEMTPGEEKK